MRASYPLDMPPNAALIEELTFGKLFSETTEAPEDLHVTSRTSGVSDAMTAALQIQSLFPGHDLEASRIDPKCAGNGVFLIRTLRIDGARADHVALVRARLRDHVSLSGARRSHPQLVASVVDLDDFQKNPRAIIEIASGKRAERVSMDIPREARFGNAHPLSMEPLNGAPPPLSPTSNPALLTLLDALCARRGFSSEVLQTPTFGALDFADEGQFLETLGLALRYLSPRHRVWDDLTVNIGFDAELPGPVIRYLPSRQSPAVNLSAHGFETLLDNLRSGPVWSRSPRAGERSQRILARAPPLRSAARKSVPTVFAAVPTPLTQSVTLSDGAGWARFSRAFNAYRQRADKAEFAAEMFELAKSWSPQPESATGLSTNMLSAWHALETYIAAPPQGARLGALVDGALFHLDRIGDRDPDALASAWFSAIDSALHESIVLAPEELAALEAGDLLDRLVQQRECLNVHAILTASIALKSGGGPDSHRRKLEDRLNDAGRARSSSVGLSGLFLTSVDAIYPAKLAFAAEDRRGSANPLL